MIRVLHVIDSLDLGGAQTTLLNFARFHDRGKFALTVAPMHGRGVFSSALEAEDVPVVSLSAAKWPPGYLLSLPRLLRRGRFDVVHCHLFGSNWIAKPIAALCGVRVRVNHDQCNDRARSERWSSIVVDRLTNVLSSHIFAVSASTRDFLVHEEKISPGKISVLPNAVDVQRFSPAAPAGREAARSRIGLVPGRLVVAGLGRLHPQKNWPLFLQVASRFPEVDFVIAGGGPEEGDLRHGAPDNVRFIGFRDSREVFAAADVFMLTSDYEGMPMTLLEAMACGVPAVVSAVDGCREILGDGQGGLTARPGDVEDFVQKLEPYIDSAELRRQQGETARAKVLSSFDARHQVREIEALYARLLAGV
ncbi:MAG: glycosyltransferase [Chthoniobacterales bacterium]